MAADSGCTACTGITPPPPPPPETDNTWLLWLGLALAAVAIIQSEFNEERRS